MFHPMMRLLILVSFLSFFVGIFVMVYSQGAPWAWNVLFGCWLHSAVFFCVVLPCYEQYYHLPRAYEKVVTRVNEALQQQEEKAHLAVEFHASELPGREGILGRRYQFVVRRRRQEEGALSTLQFPCAQEMV